MADFLLLLGNVSTNGSFSSTNFLKNGRFFVPSWEKTCENRGILRETRRAFVMWGKGSVREGGAAQKKVPIGGQKYKKSRDRLELIAAFRGVRR